MQIFVITTIQVHNANTLDNMCHIIKIQLGMQYTVKTGMDVGNYAEINHQIMLIVLNSAIFPC